MLKCERGVNYKMAVNRGKDFEHVIRKSFERVRGVSIDRLNDNTAGFKGVAGICDFIVYKHPYEYYFECKSVHGNRLSMHSNDPKKQYGNITNKQWEGLLEKSKIPGVTAGIVCWWVDRDITLFLPIQFLEQARLKGFVAVPYNYNEVWVLDNYDKLPIVINGTKKRVFFDYDMLKFFEEVESREI